MALHEFAGKKAPHHILADIPRLVTAYFTQQPDPENKRHQVQFGTSGHRGTSLNGTFNEDHILAISQALANYRKREGIDGPLFIGKDTHGLSEPAFVTAVEVLAANDVIVAYQEGFGPTPTPVLSHAILGCNRSGGPSCDGVVITPSHNPPTDGGFKYNPPTGGPAGTDITTRIQNEANQLLADNLKGVRRMSFASALAKDHVMATDFMMPYINDLGHVIDMKAIRNSDLRIGVDPLGGAGIAYWEPMADVFSLNIDLINRDTDPRFAFMTVDHDGKIRMDCSSPYAMAGLIGWKDRYDIAFGNDPDYDRHGIVTRSAGLMNPNHFLSVAIDYLFRNRPEWPKAAGIGKTLVSSSMIDRVASHLERPLLEVPVGFKYFVDGLLDGSCAFGGEESAGASFVRFDGTAWSTDKDGIIMGLLAAEITARTGKDPAEHYSVLENQFGSPVYARIDAPATSEEKAVLANLSAEKVKAAQLAGEPVIARLTHAPGNQAAIGGLKVVTKNGWFAARPSGTEDIYKVYAESFLGKDHLAAIQKEAVSIVKEALSS